MLSRKYELPPFLAGRCNHEVYLRWLSRKAIAHVRRDRARGNLAATREEYMRVIHKAVRSGGENDAYTGEPLAWELISKYDNEASKQGRRVYMKTLSMLPTVDHVGDGTGPADFVICSWRTNDCKSSLSYDELIEFCQAILAHQERTQKLRSEAG